jgi:hypothetical protein
MWQIDRSREGIVREETTNEVKVEFYDNSRFKNLYRADAIYVWIRKESISRLIEY